MEKTKIIMDKINADILADLKALEEEELRIKAEKNAKKLMDEEQYYNTMKFIDASYYEWKIQQIEKEVEAMDISAEQKKRLLEKLKQDLEFEMGEANIYSSRIGNRNWFFHDLLGYDPDNPGDQQKVIALQTTYRNVISGAQNIMSQMFSINQQRKQAELDMLDEIANKENWTSEKILAEKKKINKKYEEEEKKLRRIQQGISITQAIINTAEGVTAALKWGYPLGPIFAAIISAMGAIEIALIRAQKFAQGGLFRGKGGKTDDANIIAVSDGEYIVNAEATRKNLPILNAINYNRTIPTFSDSEVIRLLAAIKDKLDILNLNVVKKESNIQINNTEGIKTTVRKIDNTRNRMIELGYAEEIGR